MSIEDIDYMKQNSFKQNYQFLINSKDRNHLEHPHPNRYNITFTEPFKNVFSLEVVDASIPRTMFSIDKYNNTLIIKKLPDGENEVSDGSQNFTTYTIPPADYNITSLIAEINRTISTSGVKIESVSNPPELQNTIRFVSSTPFLLDMGRSTIASSLGFSLTQNVSTGKFRYVPENSQNPEKFRLFYSVFDEQLLTNVVVAPGIVDLVGEKYIILHVPEIEEHSTVSLSYSRYSLGLAKFRLGVVGYNYDNLSISKIASREFHPIGKLPRLTFEFRTASGELYDFKGADHNLTLNIQYYQTRQKRELFKKSILNPNYDPSSYNFLQYKPFVDDTDEDESSSDYQEDQDDHENQGDDQDDQDE